MIKSVIKSLRRRLDRSRRSKEKLRRFAETRTALRAHDKLHLGAGTRHLEGWANIDREGDNLWWDLRKPLPVESGSVRLVYTEHFIEHVTREDGLTLLTHVRQALAPSGVVRISTPDLRNMVGRFLAGDCRGVPEHGWTPGTPCQAMNEGMRLWGHQFIYDEPELTAVLREAGFSDVRRVEWRKSEHPELDGLETRPENSDLIVEARP